MTNSFTYYRAGPQQRLKIHRLTYALCVVLAVACCAGLWKWFDLHPSINLADDQEIIWFGLYVALPFSLLFFFVSRAIQTRIHARSQSAYKSSFEQLQKRLGLQENFLQAITDADNEALAIFDRKNTYWFVNAKTAQDLGRTSREIIGLAPTHLMKPEAARQMIARLDLARRSNKPIDALEKIEAPDGSVRYIQYHYTPLPMFNDFLGGVLLREEDVTGLVLERERRESMLRQVLSALVAVVDRRDPYAAGHSSRVGQLSRMIAEEMLLPERDIEAAEIAGSLMNFGKVLVSRSILTKTTALTSEELQRVRDSILTSPEILSVIEFPGPVIKTLKQVLERVDGNGAPEGLRGEQIIATARIVAAANTYVALVSPRAHRPGLGLKEAIEYMSRDVDKVYDRAVVKALAHFIENRSNTLDWLKPAKQN